MFRALYDWTMRQAARPKAHRALAVISFLESSVFPIPPDVMLIPMCLADRSKAFRYAMICSIASVIGGMFGYAIGYFFIETIGQAIINFYGYADKWHAFEMAYDKYGAWVVLLMGFSPLPYKVATIASGATHFAFALFVLSSVVSRSARFFLVAGLLWKFGPPIRDFIERRLVILMWIFVIGLIGGFIVIKYLV